MTKYGNQRTSGFASKGESDFYQYLCLLEKAGELSGIECQVHVYLTKARINYIADFRALDTKLNELVYYEFKGFQTPEWRLKRKLWTCYGPARLRVFNGKGLRMVMTEEIIPQ